MRIELVGRAGLAVAAAAMLGSTADAQRTKTGTMNDGSTWVATNAIVGVNSTATAAGGGDPRYFAAQPAASGVVSLIMRYADGSAFICSGSLLQDRVSIVTAAHCVSDGKTARPISTTVYFPNTDPDGIPHLGANVGSRAVTNYIVHPRYTGEVIDQNDIAILRLDAPAPATARAYGLFTPASLTGSQFNVFGYGGRSDQGGNIGANLGTGRLRQGQNLFDYSWGDAAFAGFFTDRDAAGENFFGKAEVDFSFVSDFDNGRAANNAACRIANAVGAFGVRFCDIGFGANEVSVAGGDSGGPSFINGQLAAITSYGLSFGANFGDISAGLNSSFGEFNGFVPVNIHAAFITGYLVPEPATIGLTAFGLGVLGMLARRRRRVN